MDDVPYQWVMFPFAMFDYRRVHGPGSDIELNSSVNRFYMDGDYDPVTSQLIPWPILGRGSFNACLTVQTWFS
jgi:hypothetical protein